MLPFYLNRHTIESVRVELQNLLHYNLVTQISWNTYSAVYICFIIQYEINVAGSTKNQMISIVDFL